MSAQDQTSPPSQTQPRIDSLDVIIEKLRAIYHRLPWSGILCTQCDHNIQRRDMDLGCQEDDFYKLICHLEERRDQILDCAESISNQISYVEREPKYDDGSVKTNVYWSLFDIHRDITKAVASGTCADAQCNSDSSSDEE